MFVKPEAMLASDPVLTHLDSFRVLAGKFASAQRLTDEIAKATHERFNIFTTVLNASDEVRLHTRFLHCLLDPEGFHDCGSLFLDLFFATLAELPPLAHDGTPTAFAPPSNGQPWKVGKEASRPPFGQLDLLIEQPGSVGFAIENKIYAAEQDRQIARYSDYLTGRHGSSAQVLYLTLDARESNTHEGARYGRISYAKQILAWLEKCLAATYAVVPVNQVILQYRGVVRTITGKTLARDAMNPIAEFIFAHPEIIKYRPQIDQGIRATRALFLDRLAVGITAELAKDGFTTRLRADLIDDRFGVDPNGAMIIVPPSSSPLHGVPFEIWVEHIDIWKDAVVVGIESRYKKPPLSATDQAVLERMNAILTADAEASGYQKVEPRSTWTETYWPTGSHNLLYPFTDVELAELLALPLAEVAKEMAEEIRVHVSMLTQAYLEATGGPLTKFPRR